MAVSTIAQYTGGGIKLPCILAEGAPTVTKMTMGEDGYFDTGIVWESRLDKGSWVVPDVQEENTYEATKGLPVVKAITNGTLLVGQIVSEPTLVKAPATSAAADTHAKRLAGQYYRVATVEWFGLTGVAKAVLNTANAAAIVPGVAATLLIDASASVALAAVDPQGPVTIGVVDVESGGSGIISFHYAAQEIGGQYNLLVGFTGGPVVIQA